jgi:hypothetical protein
MQAFRRTFPARTKIGAVLLRCVPYFIVAGEKIRQGFRRFSVTRRRNFYAPLRGRVRARLGVIHEKTTFGTHNHNGILARAAHADDACRRARRGIQSGVAPGEARSAALWGKDAERYPMPSPSRAQLRALPDAWRTFDRPENARRPGANIGGAERALAPVAG